RLDPSSQKPRRNPISPAVAAIYADSREAAASTSSTSPGVVLPTATPPATHTTAPTKPAPKHAHASAFHIAVPVRAAATGRYHRSHASRPMVTRRRPMPVTRTSLPGGAVVAVQNR